jgi:hypothetical protein
MTSLAPDVGTNRRQAWEMQLRHWCEQSKVLFKIYPMLFLAHARSGLARQGIVT